MATHCLQLLGSLTCPYCLLPGKPRATSPSSLRTRRGSDSPALSGGVQEGTTCLAQELSWGSRWHRNCREEGGREWPQWTPHCTMGLPPQGLCPGVHTWPGPSSGYVVPSRRGKDLPPTSQPQGHRLCPLLLVGQEGELRAVVRRGWGQRPWGQRDGHLPCMSGRKSQAQRGSGVSGPRASPRDPTAQGRVALSGPADPPGPQGALVSRQDPSPGALALPAGARVPGRGPTGQTGHSWPPGHPWPTVQPGVSPSSHRNAEGSGHPVPRPH